MSVSDGQRVNAQVTNAAFLSRTTDSDTTGVVGLNNASSGGLIPNAQQAINDNASNISSNDTDIADLQANKIDVAEKGANNGVATLDGTGRIPSSQLTLEVVEFKGVWDANTNTPTLADGVGNTGDVYRVSVAGTQDLGSGSQDFNIGDWVTYSDLGVWERSDFGGGVDVLTTKGDLLSRDNSTAVRLPVGTDGQVLLADSAESSGLRWGSVPTSNETIQLIAANYTLLATDDAAHVTTGVSNITITLPTAVGISGKRYRIVKTDGGTGQVQIQTFSSGSEAINSADLWNGSYYLNQEGAFIDVVSNGARWDIVNLSVGELISISAAPFSGINFVAGVYQDITSITLPEGTWQMEGFVHSSANIGTPASPFDLQNGLGTVAGNSSTGLAFTTGTLDFSIVQAQLFFTVKNILRAEIFVPTGGQTYYLKQQASITTTAMRLNNYRLIFRREF